MNKLLSAGVFQLRKNKTFLLGMLFMFGLGIVAVITMYSEIVKYNGNQPVDKFLFIFIILVGGCAAVFSSLFIGTEYSDGTIRNKLIVGHTRSNLYFSNLLVSIIATFIMAASFLLPYCTLGAFLLNPPGMQAGAIVYYFIISIFTMTAFTSLFTMLSMLITKKSTSAVICLLIFIALLVAALMVKTRLDAPEYISSYSMSINGVEQAEPKLNPKYLKEAARAIYQFFYDLLPSGQSLQLFMTDVIHPVQMMVYSFCIMIVTSVGGVWVFRKKDLK